MLLSGDKCVPSSDLIGQLNVLSGLNRNFSSNSFGLNFKSSDIVLNMISFGIETSNCVTEGSNGGLTIANSFLVGGNVGISVGNAGLKSSLGIPSGIQLVFKIPDVGLNFSEFEVVVGDSVSGSIVGLSQDGDLVVQSSDSCFVGGNLAGNIVKLRIKRSQLVHEVLKACFKLIEIEIGSSSVGLVD